LQAVCYKRNGATSRDDWHGPCIRYVPVVSHWPAADT
jgi:hypothetical protein